MSQRDQFGDSLVLQSKVSYKNNTLRQKNNNNSFGCCQESVSTKNSQLSTLNSKMLGKVQDLDKQRQKMIEKFEMCVKRLESQILKKDRHILDLMYEVNQVKAQIQDQKKDIHSIKKYVMKNKSITVHVGVNKSDNHDVKDDLNKAFAKKSPNASEKYQNQMSPKMSPKMSPRRIIKGNKLFK